MGNSPRGFKSLFSFPKRLYGREAVLWSVKEVALRDVSSTAANANHVLQRLRPLHNCFQTKCGKALGKFRKSCHTWFRIRDKNGAINFDAMENAGRCYAQRVGFGCGEVVQPDL